MRDICAVSSINCCVKQRVYNTSQPVTTKRSAPSCFGLAAASMGTAKDAGDRGDGQPCPLVCNAVLKQRGGVFSVAEFQALYRRLNVSSAFYTRGNQVTEQEGDVAPGSSGIQGTPFRAGSVLWPLAASDTEKSILRGTENALGAIWAETVLSWLSRRLLLWLGAPGSCWWILVAPGDTAEGRVSRALPCTEHSSPCCKRHAGQLAETNNPPNLAGLRATQDPLDGYCHNGYLNYLRIF